MQTVVATRQRPQVILAAHVVPHLARVKSIRAAMEESALRLRVCASRESFAREQGLIQKLRDEGARELMASRQILMRCTTDSPLLRDAAKSAIQKESMLLWEAERNALDSKNNQSFEKQEPLILDQPRHQEGNVLMQPIDVDELEKIFAEERHREMQEIEVEISALSEAMQDVSRMVNDSGAPLDSIEIQIQKSKMDGFETNESLAAAERDANTRRKRKLKLVLFGVAVVLTLGVGLVVYKVVK
jgi:hypothetical protein